jgi:hypothetical protein
MEGNGVVVVLQNRRWHGGMDARQREEGQAANGDSRFQLIPGGFPCLIIDDSAASRIE